MLKNKRLKSAISIGLLIVFGTIIASYVYTNWHEFSSITVSNPIMLLAALIVISASIYASGAVIDLAMEPHGVKISRYEAFGLANITRFSNQISPAYVGAAVRAAYMKKVHNISFAKFSSSFIFNNLLQLVVAGILALASMVVVSPELNNIYSVSLICLSVLIFITILALPIKPYLAVLNKIHTKPGTVIDKLLERLSAAISGYSLVRSHPHLLARTIYWLVFIMLSSALSYYLVYMALGINIGFTAALFISTLSSWAVVLSLTPGGIGIKEGLMVLAAQIAGVSVASTLIVALMMRLLMFVASGVFTMYFTPRLLGDNSRDTHENK